MTEVNPPLPDHAIALLDSAYSRFRDALLDEIEASGMPRHMADLRGAHIRLLQLTPEGGMRATDLAARAGMTKQALGELAVHLERTGHLESTSDPTDRRVRIWRHTALGREAAKVAGERVAAVERRWSTRLGPTEWRAFRATLLRIRDEL
jgi:DNA-binding MarR family transcriptional regulator